MSLTIPPSDTTPSPGQLYYSIRRADALLSDEDTAYFLENVPRLSNEMLLEVYKQGMTMPDDEAMVDQVQVCLRHLWGKMQMDP